MALVVGLGNPGSKYASTRHNVGFMVVDRAAQRCRCEFEEQRYRADVARTARKGIPLVFLKPRTFMNESGVSVGPASLDLCSPDLSDLLIVLDDVHLELGRLRLRPGGSDGGHNGLASVLARLGTDRVPRLRVGIGGASVGGRADYVLGEFNEDEQELLPDIIERASETVLAWFYTGIEAAMNRFNRVSPEEET